MEAIGSTESVMLLVLFILMLRMLNRIDLKQMFDIGLAGPLAGLLLTVPLVWIGILHAGIDAVVPVLLQLHFEVIQRLWVVGGNALERHLGDDFVLRRPRLRHACYLSDAQRVVVGHPVGEIIKFVQPNHFAVFPLGDGLDPLGIVFQQ